MLVQKVLAANNCIGPDGVNIPSCFPPAQKFNNLGQVVNVFSQNIILIAGIIFVILIMVAGFGVIMGAGSQDAQKLEKNKAFLTYAVIGFVIIFGAYWIVQIINAVTGGALGGIFK